MIQIVLRMVPWQHLMTIRVEMIFFGKYILQYMTSLHYEKTSISKTNDFVHKIGVLLFSGIAHSSNFPTDKNIDMMRLVMFVNNGKLKYF